LIILDLDLLFLEGDRFDILLNFEVYGDLFFTLKRFDFLL